MNGVFPVVETHGQRYEVRDVIAFRESGHMYVCQ